MSEAQRNSWLVRRAENALRRGFTRAYDTVRVDPSRYLLQLQTAHGLPISTFQGVYSVDVEALDNVAEQTIRAGMKMAAVEGAGLGVGGMLTILPDLSILAAITLRKVLGQVEHHTAQKRSMKREERHRARSCRAVAGCGQRGRRRHRPRISGKGISEPAGASHHSAHRGAGQQRGGGKMVGPADSHRELVHWRWP